MIELGNKIANKRKALGLTQIEFAERMMVTRQTISRWETGQVLPDIDKINDIASQLGVTCDYLLRDDVEVAAPPVDLPKPSVSKILESLVGQTVQLNFFPEEFDLDLYDVSCQILELEGQWMRVRATVKDQSLEKLIPLSSVQSIEFIKEES